MISEKPSEGGVIIQQPGDLHGTPRSTIIHNDSVASAVLAAWTVVVTLALIWICWWGIRSRRIQHR